MANFFATVKKTFKSTDTEEILDIYFFQPFGYLMAIVVNKLNISPNAVTHFSIVVGVASGHMFFYDDLFLNIIGVLLLIWAEALDSTDGQLARIQNIKSRYGRILDGVGGNLWFVSIYIHLCFRLVIHHDYSPIVFAVAIIAGISHSFQSAYADHFRNYFLFFVFGEDKSEIDDAEKMKKEYKEMKWTDNPFKKFLMRVYVNYTVQQELFGKKTKKLYETVKEKYSQKPDEEFSRKYRSMFKPLVKYYNILTTNTRMIVLFISILSGYYMLYFYFELTLLNLLLVYTIYKQESKSEELLNTFEEKTETESLVIDK